MENEQKDEEEVKPSTSSMLPVQPKNGTMKTYENPSRTFTRPYSAKTVFFYKEGDLFFTGVRLPISQHRFKTMHNLMDELNRSIYLPYGVRNITTPMGRTNISRIDQLEHLGKYVASSSNPPRGVDLDKIQEKYSATLRRQEPRVTAGGHSYWMPTTPTLPARINISRVIRAFNNFVSAKQVFFVLNGKGKFHRSLINPMKMPSMEQLLEECSTHLEVAIHRLYTPEGKLITTVDEILAYDGPRIIACPRNERPHLHEKSGSIKVKLPEINPTRYAPRQAYSKIETKSSAGSSVGADVSGPSSGNSIEKRQRLPAIKNRYVPRKSEENGISNNITTITTTTATYIPKSFATKIKRTVTEENPNESTSNDVNIEMIKENDPVVTNSARKKANDSGNGTSISSNSQQSERPLSTTERKAKMIREEENANAQQQNNGFDHYSEEDIIKEEESDYDRNGGGIQSGTSEDEDEKQKEEPLRSTKKLTSKARAPSAAGSSRTPARMTSSTSEFGRRSRMSTAADVKTRLKTMSRQDTPYQSTPSRQNTANSRPSTSESLEPKSLHSSRASTSSRVVLEASDDDAEDLEEVRNIQDEGEDDTNEENDDTEEEEDDDEFPRETPAIHTPDTRLPTAKSRQSTGGTVRSFDSESSRAWSRISGYSDKEQILPSDEEEDPYRDIGTAERERLGEAATKIQAAYKGYSTRKKKVQFVKEKERREQEKIEYDEQMDSYTIEFLLGERFGVEFETRLYVIIHGDDGTSRKIYTEKLDWLFEKMECYEPHSWIVETVKIPKLGVLKSVDVGHEKEGYGAGTYIERIVISEGSLDGRQFHFLVDKWFDSGQVDGLIERNVKLSCFAYQNSARDGERKRVSKGRWEFRLHTMESDLGGTTSNIIVIGYGPYDCNSHFVKNDSLMRDPYSVPRIQIDFGTDIGKLQKVRFEIDGTGDKPNYFLDNVEAMDLDTREKCVLMVNNWLLKEATSEHRKWQAFREIPIVTHGYYPSLARTFEGTTVFADKSLMLTDNNQQLYLQYHCESIDEDEIITRDSSGLFPVVPIKMKNGKTHYSFKVEVVTMLNVQTVRIIPQVTQLGKDILSGLSILQDMYSQMVDAKLLDKEIQVGSDLFIEKISQKSGDHVPYSTTYGVSSIDFEQNNAKGPYFKMLAPTAAEKVSTERKWKKGESKITNKMAVWQLSISFLKKMPGNPVIPTIVLVTKDKRTFEMECETEKIEENEHGWRMKYTLTAPNFGNPHKVRVSCENAGPDNYTYLYKIFLTELYSKTEVFVRIDAELNEYDTHELECYYPDFGSAKAQEYEIKITTLEGEDEFRPYINIVGEVADTGYRAFSGICKFNKDETRDMIVSALDLKELKSLEMWAKVGNPTKWKGTIEVITFKYWAYKTGILSLSENGQIALAPLEFIGIVPPPDESAESSL